MSERGSIVTEFIYCSKCLEKVKTTLESSEDFQEVTLISNSIIAAKIHPQWPGGEFTILDILFDADNAPCHDVRFAIHSDNGRSAILKLFPDGHFEVMPPVEVLIRG
jgi:hypothetical protein